MDTPIYDQTPVSDEMEPVDYAAVEPLNRPELLACGTYATTDLDRARKFHEEYYGLECVRHREGAMLIRDKGHQWKGHRRDGDYWVWEVQERAEIAIPQDRANHWGVDLESREAVDRAHAIAEENKERWGFKIVQRCVAARRGDYVFKIRDWDDNWWEVQYAPARTEEFAAADGFGIDDGAYDPAGPYTSDNPALRTYFMSHGTIECRGNGNAARRFYAEFLGIGEPHPRPHVRSHGVGTMHHWYVACLPSKRMHPQPADNRWIYAANTRDEITKFHDLAYQYRERYRIQEIEPVQESEDAVLCRLRDLDGNWWEFQWRDAPAGRWHDEAFARGDVV